MCQDNLNVEMHGFKFNKHKWSTVLPGWSKFFKKMLTTFQSIETLAVSAFAIPATVLMILITSRMFILYLTLLVGTLGLCLLTQTWSVSVIIV